MALTPEEKEQRKAESLERSREANRKEKRELAERQRQEQRDRANELREKLRAGGEDIEGYESTPDGAVRPRRWALPIFQDPDNGATGHSARIEPHELDEFLEILAETGKFMHSCHMVGRAAPTIRDEMERNHVFADLVEQAKAAYRESLEMEAVRRGRDGVLEPIYSQQHMCIIGSKRVYSDRLLEVTLKAEMPEKYRENIQINSDRQFGALVVPAVTVDMEEWMRLYGPDAQRAPLAAPVAEPAPEPAKIEVDNGE